MFSGDEITKKVYVKQQNGAVVLRKVSVKTLRKHYITAESLTGKKYYVYRKAKLEYDPIENEFYWIGAKAKYRRSHHKATIYIRKTPPPEKRAIEIRFDTYFAPAHAEQPSPFPELHQSFWVPKAAVNWTYTFFDFGTYNERWRIGLLSDILHRIMYNAGKSMYDGSWKLWRIPEYEDKVAVKLPGKKKDSEPVYRDFELLIEAINHAFEEVMK
jgi:hypothetical protein